MRTFARARLAALALALAVVASCFAERRGLSRDVLLSSLNETKTDAALPSLADVVALRVPDPPPRPREIDAAKPADPLARARLEAARGDLEKARAAWAAPTPAPTPANAPGAELLAERCLVESVVRRYDDVVDGCGRFLDAAPADPRAVGAVRLLTKASNAVRAAGVLVARKGASWLDGCRQAVARRGSGDCADLAFLVAAARADEARIEKDEHGYAAAVADTGRLRRAVVEGPFDGDVRSDLLKDARGEAQVPRRPAFHVARFVDEDGVFSPGLRGPDGLYRVRFAGRGEGKAELLVTGVHAVRVRIDGVVVADRSVDEPTPAVTRAAVQLSPGMHVVDVLAWSAGRGDDVSVALLRGDGAPALVEPADAAGLDAALASGAAHGTAKVTALSGAVEAMATPIPDVAAGAGPGSADVDSLFRLAWRTTVDRSPSLGVDPDEVRQISTALVGRFGWSPLALAVAAELVGEDRSVPDRVASSAAARLWAKVKESWPDHPVARIAEARNDKEQRPDEALAAYRGLVTAQPRYPFGRRELIDVALEHGLVDEARASADALLAIDHGPDNIDAALPALRASGDFATAARLDDERAQLDDSFTSLRAARRLLDLGRTDDGLAALDRAAHAERGSPAFEEWIDLLALRAPKQALAAVNAAVSEFPDDPSLHLKKAQLLAAVDGDQAALAFLAASLPRIRESESAARYAEELGMKTPWADRLALGDEVIARRRAMTSEPFPGFPAVALLDDVERDLYEDESSLVVHHFVIELRTKEILDRFGEISVGDARVIRLRVVKPDGSVVERERHRGVDDVSLPQLGVGDIVELLTVERDGPSHIGGGFETRELDGTPTPALSRRYIVTWPDGFDEAHALTLIARNGLPTPPKERIVDGAGAARTRVVFAVENAGGTPSEPFAPSRVETAKTAGYAWGVDDALWARLRGILVEESATRTAWLDEAARRIAGPGDDLDKLRRVFAFVARKIEPHNSPDDASAALASGAGQRTPLLLALLRGAGLDADPVALQLATQPDPSTLDLGSWSTLAVRVRIAGQEHFAVVDGNAVLDRLPPSARGARVLDLALASTKAPTGPSESVLPDAALDTAGVRVQADLGLEQGGGTASLGGLVVVTIPAAKADGARRGVRRATPEQLRTVVERAFAETFPGISVVDVRTPDLERNGEPLRLGARVKVPLPQNADGTVRFDHLFAQGASGGLGLTTPLAAYLQVADRKTPMLVGAEREVLEMQVTLPKTAAFVEAPESLSLAAGPISLEQKVEIDDGKLYWRRVITKENARIPVDRWPGVRVTLASLAARVDARLSFVLGARVPAPRGGMTSDTTGRIRATADQNR